MFPEEAIAQTGLATLQRRGKDRRQGASFTLTSPIQTSLGDRFKKRTAEGEKSLTCVATLSRGDGPQERQHEALTGLFGVTELAVFVLDKRQKPLMLPTEKRAGQLLECRRAVVQNADRHGYAVSASPVRDGVPTAFLPA
jgi:hypothetical protein